MKLEQLIQKFAHRFLPPFIRKPLGNLCGRIRSYVFYPLMGLAFDATGGRFKADGCSFIIPRNITSLEFRACFLIHSYEKDERKLVQKYILPEDKVLELGACLGIVSCITNKLLHIPSRHVVVEANPYCIPAIYRNRHRNGAAFLVENCAISNQCEVEFFINPRYVTGSAIGNYSKMSVRLPGRSLNALSARYGPFSTLIMDIEGSELEVLESSTETLQNLRLIIIELHENIIDIEGINRCRAILQQSGFNMVERSYISEAWLKN